MSPSASFRRSAYHLLGVAPAYGLNRTGLRRIALGPSGACPDPACNRVAFAGRTDR